MKKLFLHIGTHKTGTSSIQKALFENRSLLEDQGFYYFCTDYDLVEKHQPQQWINLHGFDEPRLRDPDKLIQLLGDIKHENIILSTESLSWFYSEDSIRHLHQVFSDFDVYVICYIRRQDQQLVSYLQEGSKNRHKPSAVYYQHPVVSLPDINRFDYLDYNTTLTRYAEIFGKEKLIVRVFEKEKLVGGDSVSDFSNILKIEGVPACSVNRSLSFFQQKIGHLVGLSDLSNHQLEYLIRKNAPKEGKMLPSIHRAQEFYEQFKIGNSQLNSLLNISDKEDIFSDDFSSYPEQPSDQWEESTANRAIISILNSVHASVHKKDTEYQILLNDYIELLRLYAADAKSSENVRTAIEAAYKSRPKNESIADLHTQVHANTSFIRQFLGRISSHIPVLSRRYSVQLPKLKD